MYSVFRVENFSLQAAYRWQEALPPALGLVDTAATRGVILEANAAAQADSVFPGITVAQALARSPDIRLGMMAVLQDSIALCKERGRPVDLAQLPQDDPPTFDLMCRADTIGVFQIESRAQMATLPRMQPRTFYDLVVEVAIIRPGPIQGEMVHPCLARRAGEEPVTYLDERLRPVLERTLGVPLFQEQLLRMAMVMADFDGSEAEELRRALSFHRSQERMAKVCEKLRAGMARNGTPEKVAEAMERSIRSFAVYGFPESHAISFALLTYASCWLKVHRTAEFYASILNNQPMGFYSPATLVRDVRSRGIRVRPVCIEQSGWHCTVETDDTIRLGFCLVQGLSHEEGARLLAQRKQHPFRSVIDLRQRIRLAPAAARNLARIGALNPLAGHRRAALCQVEGTLPEPDLFDQEDRTLPLAEMNDFERLSADYSGTGVTTGPHPMRLLRPNFPEIWRARDIQQAEDEIRIHISGLVICRQRPGSAKGFVFISLEDETGVANAIVAPPLFEARRLCITQEPFLTIIGQVQNKKGVVLIRAEIIEALRTDAGQTPISHDFH